MPHFIRINDEIFNLDRVLRIERTKTEGDRLTVHIHFAGGDPTIFTGAPASAVWEKFAAISQFWNIPASEPFSPAGPGRVDNQQM